MDLEHKFISDEEADDLKGTMKGEVCTLAPAPGALCPRCRNGRLDYNSLLNLQCPMCGYETAAGGCT